MTYSRAIGSALFITGLLGATYAGPKAIGITAIMLFFAMVGSWLAFFSDRPIA